MKVSKIGILVITAAGACLGYHLGNPNVTQGNKSSGTQESGLNPGIANPSTGSSTPSNADSVALKEAKDANPPRQLPASFKKLYGALSKAGVADIYLGLKASTEDPEFREFFEAIGLPKEKQEAILKVISMKRHALMDRILELGKQKEVTFDDVVQSRRKGKGIVASYDKQILEMLETDEQRDQYQRWFSTRYDRNKVAELEDTFNKQFQPQQADKIVEALNTQQKQLAQLMKNPDDQNLSSNISAVLGAKLGGLLTSEEIGHLIQMKSTPKPTIVSPTLK